jgi:hypothetical protein
MIVDKSVGRVTGLASFICKLFAGAFFDPNAAIARLRASKSGAS